MFRFSIREILFAMVTIAAIIALFVQSLPSESTDLPKNLNPKVLAENAAAEYGMKFKYVGGGHGGGKHDSGVRYQRTATIQSPQFDESGKLLAGIRKKVESEIRGAGCTVVGGGYSGVNENDITQFSVTYERGKTRGEVFVRANRPVSAEDKHWEIWMLSYEYSN